MLGGFCDLCRALVVRNTVRPRIQSGTGIGINLSIYGYFTVTWSADIHVFISPPLTRPLRRRKPESEVGFPHPFSSTLSCTWVSPSERTSSLLSSQIPTSYLGTLPEGMYTFCGVLRPLCLSLCLQQLLLLAFSPPYYINPSSSLELPPNTSRGPPRAYTKLQK